MNGQDDLENWRCLTGSSRGVLGIPKHPHLPETGFFSPQYAASPAMVQAGGWQHVLIKSIRDRVQRPGRNSYRKEELGRAVHQLQSEFISFRTLVCSSKLLYQTQGSNHHSKRVVVKVPTALLVYFTKQSGAYMHQHVDSC